MTEADIRALAGDMVAQELRSLAERFGDLAGRVSALERGEQATTKDIERLESKMDHMTQMLAEMQQSIIERRGVDRVAGWVFDILKMILAASLGGAATHYLHTH